MSDLIGRTVSYTHHGQTIVRKVLCIIRREHGDIYRLFDPINKVYHEAFVKVFNQMFAHTKVAVKPKGTKGSKGKAIVGKQKTY